MVMTFEAQTIKMNVCCLLMGKRDKKANSKFGADGKCGEMCVCVYGIEFD